MSEQTKAQVAASAPPVGAPSAEKTALAWLHTARFLTTASKIAELKSDAQTYLKQAMRADARSASDARYDGQSDDGADWATEATR